MEASNIPRFFWISLSFCMVVATLGILGIALQSATVSIEIADAKITMSSALADVKEIKTDLELENMKLQKEKEALEILLTDLKQATDNPKKILHAFLMNHSFGDNSDKRADRLRDLDVKINTVDKIIRKD
jgi:hypothetical protein